jgi:putative transposase
MESGDGLKLEKSNSSKLLEGCICTTSHHSTHLSIQKLMQMTTSSLYCTQECHLTSKKTTLTDNKSICDQIFLTNIPDPKRSKLAISDLELTLKDPDCYEFFDSSRKEKYHQLSWLQGTEWQGLDLNSSNGCVKSSEPKFWFSTTKTQLLNQNSERTSCPLSKFIVVDGMDKEDIKIESKIKARKLKLKPSKDQKVILNQWAGCCRFIYNKTIGLLTNKSNKTLRSEFKIRDRLVTLKGKRANTSNNFYNNKQWLLDCPRSVKQYAIKEARSNLSSCFTNKARGNINKFKSPFRTKKQEVKNGWSFSLENSNISKKGNSLFIFTKTLGEMKYHKTKQLHKLIPNNTPSMDCKVQKNAFGEYFLVIPYVCVAKEKTKVFNHIAAGDPGVRKFVTTYSPDGESFMFGNRWSTRVFELLLQLDKLYSRLSKEPLQKTRQHLKRQIISVRKKVANLKTELKFQTANLISNRYDLFMMPKLDTLKLAKKGERKLTTKVVRTLQNAGHSSFFKTLKDKCWEHGKHFLHVREEYTSQTCPNCGVLNKCGESYSCKSCRFHHDRDIVGALNILLKGVRTEDPSV